MRVTDQLADVLRRVQAEDASPPTPGLSRYETAITGVAILTLGGTLDQAPVSLLEHALYLLGQDLASGDLAAAEGHFSDALRRGSSRLELVITEVAIRALGGDAQVIPVSLEEQAFAALGESLIFYVKVNENRRFILSSQLLAWSYPTRTLNSSNPEVPDTLAEFYAAAIWANPVRTFTS